MTIYSTAITNTMTHWRSLTFATLFAISGCQTTLPTPHSTLTAIAQRAQSGDAAAQLQLAAFYSRGDGVEKNYPESARWLTLAAQQNNAAAQGILATMYYEGVGVPQDYTQAARWAHSAAMQGDSTGQSVLGMMYFEGRGYTQNYAEAYAWFALAAVHGDSLEVQNRDRAAEKLSATTLQKAQHRATALAQQISAGT
ncbi:MAG TPA: tetratricopeptide repeat protein [Pseudomonadales bacterium]|nr:tetratricopeptide repeat protein [Pseudomonadales bacterium]HNI37487.1 tetratricopeptide repeat protein [Pseudomonadales bacterium]